jgi:hypothetical protein
MHFRLRTLLAAASGLALVCSMANAQLMLSGHTTGSFVNLGEPHTTVTNAPDGSWAQFHTGVPVAGSTQTKIDFTNATFTNVDSGDPIQVGIFKIKNGTTRIGTGAHTAQFNIGLQLTSPEMMALAVSTITFNIAHTVNHGPGGTPDQYSVSFGQPAAVNINGYKVQFHVDLEPPVFVVPENATVTKGDIFVTFSAVPEPSTYAIWAAGLLIGFVAIRRIRGDRQRSSFLEAV